MLSLARAKSAGTEVFGNMTPVPLEDGIAEMAKWAREKGPRPPVQFKELTRLRSTCHRAGVLSPSKREAGFPNTLWPSIRLAVTTRLEQIYFVRDLMPG